MSGNISKSNRRCLDVFIKVTLMFIDNWMKIGKVIFASSCWQIHKQNRKDNFPGVDKYSVSLHRAAWITSASSLSASLAPPSCHKRHCSRRQRWSNRLIWKWKVSSCKTIPSNQNILIWRVTWSSVIIYLLQQKLSRRWGPEVRTLISCMWSKAWQQRRCRDFHQEEASPASENELL